MIRLRRLVAREFRQLADIDLTFPPRGRILVQGNNEAGKSTLFEAVFVALFGKPLDGKKLDDCVQYGQEQAWLELELELSGGRTMTVTRRIRATAARNRYELVLTKPDGTTETVQGAPVSERIEAELGLDGEALLNTCFVEQKKLEKLEGMGLREREQSLMKLLNLDRLVALADELKVTRADQADVQRLRDRLALAQLQARLPALDAELSAATTALARAEAAAALAAAATERRALDALAAERAAAEAEANRIAERAAAAERLRDAMQALREAATARDRAREAVAACMEADRAASEAAAARDTLAAVADQGTRLATLGRRRDGVDRLAEEHATTARWVESADTQLKRLAEAREALNDTRRGLVEARAAERDAAGDAEVAGQDGRAFDVRDGLRGWVEAVAHMADGDAPERAMRETDAERIHARSRSRAQVTLWFGIAAILWLASMLVADRVPIGIAYALQIAGTICVSVSLVRWFQARDRVARLDRTIARLEGEASVAEARRAMWAERRTAAEQRLRELNAVAPTDPSRAAAALAELDARLGDRSRTDVAEALEAARDTRSRAAAQIEALVRRESELRQLDGPVDAQALARERAAKAARVERLGRFIERATAHIERSAARVDVAPDRAAIQEAVASMRGRWAALREQADRLPALVAARAKWEGEAAGRWAEAENGWRNIESLVADVGERAWPAWDPAASDQVWEQLAGRLAHEYAAAGGDAVREAHRAAAAKAAGVAARHGDAVGRWRGTVRGVGAWVVGVVGGAGGDGDAGGMGDAFASPLRGGEGEERGGDILGVDHVAALVGDDDPSVEALEAAGRALGGHGAADISALVDRRDRVVRDIDVGRHEQARLAAALGLRGEALDVGTCREAVDEGERALAVRELGYRIVDDAGRSVVHQVLPSTLDYMRRLLPALTDGRYFDARLTDDYRIETWDERAAAWQKKNLFSGGTKDQFSLALRLSFAMATLPEERGAAPSFLFLDEPLGAFDDQRAGALVHLLTEGEVAEAFDQIFLISHVRVDDALFDHRIVMEGGRVIEGHM